MLREILLIIIACLVAGTFALLLDGFLTLNNWLTLLRSVSVLTILSVGASVVIISGGIDLASVAIMIASAGWVLQLVHDGSSPPVALALGLSLATAIGLANGLVVTFLEVTPLLATLASGFIVVGVTKVFLIAQSVVYVPQALEPYRGLSRGAILGVPAPVVIALVACVVVHIFLTRTKIGVFTQANGDNPRTAFIIGLPRRLLTAYPYVASALIAFLAGLVTAGSAGGINVQIVNGTLIFDVILVAVLGGVSLSGGQGRLPGVLAAAVLIGIILNGMTLMNISNVFQDIFKSTVLLAAILVDRLLNPVDAETAKQGDL